MPQPLGLDRIPIIGQPRVSNWFFTVQIICPCGEPLLIIGQLGSRGACPNPECGKVYQLNGMPSITEAGHVSVPLGMSVPVKPGSTS